MNPALNGAQTYETEEWIYFAGGQDSSNTATNIIYKIKRVEPTAVEKAGTMAIPRVDPFFFKAGDKVVILGGSTQPLMEVFNDKLEPVKGFEKAGEAFYQQLQCYTTDVKLENCSYG